MMMFCGWTDHFIHTDPGRGALDRKCCALDTWLRAPFRKVRAHPQWARETNLVWCNRVNRYMFSAYRHEMAPSIGYEVQHRLFESTRDVIGQHFDELENIYCFNRFEIACYVSVILHNECMYRFLNKFTLEHALYAVLHAYSMAECYVHFVLRYLEGAVLVWVSGLRKDLGPIAREYERRGTGLLVALGLLMPP